MAELPFKNLSASNEMFLAELKPEIERLTDRHVAMPREYYPFDFADQMEQAEQSGFDPLDAPIAPEVIVSLRTNLHTEDGLPYYTVPLFHGLPKNHPFREWLHHWTAEEGKHGPTIANWLHRTRQVDMRQLERDRMIMMTNPDTPQPESFIEGVAYPAFQEPATEISHRNTMQLLPKAHKIGRNAIAWVIGDEKKHGIFYGDLMSAAFEVDSSLALQAVANQIVGFGMPGKGIPDFESNARIIGKAGIFNAEILLGIFHDLTSQWRIWDLPVSSENDEKALRVIKRRLDALGKIAARENEKLLAIG